MIDEIILGSCLDVMPKIDKGAIDLIICDLPYGSTQNKWDIIIPFDALWNNYERIIKPNGAIILTATQPFASHLIASNSKLFKYDLIWKKNRKTGFLNAKKMPLRQHEIILVFYKKCPVYNPQKTTGHNPVNSFTARTFSSNYGKSKEYSGGGQTDRFPTSIVEVKCLNNDSKDRLHPTQKPTELFEYLIKTYSNKGDLVLDNCIGSGTTAIAALNTGRHFIGIENDEEYFKAAQQRIQNHMLLSEQSTFLYEDGSE